MRLRASHERDREEGRGGLWCPLIPWPLLSSAQPSLTPQGPGSLAFVSKPWGLLAAAGQDLHVGGESSSPSSSKPWMEKPRCLLQAGCLYAGCLYTGCPSQPLSHLSFPPASRWETTAKPFPCLTTSSWHTMYTAIQWGSKCPTRVLLTLGSGKSTWASALPYFFSSSLYMPSAMRLWKQSTSWDIRGLCITSENDLRTIIRVILLEQNWANEQNCVLEPGIQCRKS